MYLFLYNIFLALFNVGVRIAAFSNTKAKQWLEGRKGVFQKIQKTINDSDKIVWFHCASLGEFEQGRPVIEKIKVDFPNYKILVTFFSPSGYDIRKNYALADYVFYLPMDSAANAKKFLTIVKPSLVVFVKYEFWYYYFKEIRNRNIPFLLISAVFRKNQLFFKWYGSLYKTMLAAFTHLFVQDAASKDLLATLGFEKNTSVAGDTRFDRVVEIADKFEPIPAIEKFCNNAKVIVAGSTWPDDEKVLQKAFSELNDPSVKLIIAPHEIGKEHLAEIKKLFPSAIFCSQLISSDSLSDSPLTIDNPIAIGSPLIIDSIGLLSKLYYYAHTTYVGGGFTSDGIHNTLEAAVYGKPVLFGPNYKKYREAVDLIEADGAKNFSTVEELKQIISTLLNDSADYQEKCRAAKNFVASNKGATEKIVSYIQENRLLTN